MTYTLVTWRVGITAIDIRAQFRPHNDRWHDLEFLRCVAHSLAFLKHIMCARKVSNRKVFWNLMHNFNNKDKPVLSYTRKNKILLEASSPLMGGYGVSPKYVAEAPKSAAVDDGSRLLGGG